MLVAVIPYCTIHGWTAKVRGWVRGGVGTSHLLFNPSLIICLEGEMVTGQVNKNKRDFCEFKMVPILPSRLLYLIRFLLPLTLYSLNYRTHVRYTVNCKYKEVWWSSKEVCWSRRRCDGL